MQTSNITNWHLPNGVVTGDSAMWRIIITLTISYNYDIIFNYRFLRVLLSFSPNCEPTQFYLVAHLTVTCKDWLGQQIVEKQVNLL
jgi:hypothetical protein